MNKSKFPKLWTILSISLASIIVIALGFLLLFPVALISPNVVNLGHIPDRVYKEYKFKIFNLGLRPIAISKVSTGCACLGNPIASPVIRPFSSVEMSGRFSSGYKRRTLNEIILVESNSFLTPVLKAFVSGYVSPQIIIEPDQVPAGTVQHSELPVDREIVVKFEDSQLNQDIAVRSDRPYASVRISKSKDPNIWIATTTLSEATPVGVISGNIEVESRVDGWNRKIAIAGRVVGTISCDPETVYLGDINHGTVLPEPVAVKIAGMNLNNVSFSIEPKSANSRLTVSRLNESTLKIDVRANASPGIIQGRVVIAESDKRTLELPVFGYIVPRDANNASSGDSDRIAGQ